MNKAKARVKTQKQNKLRAQRLEILSEMAMYGMLIIMLIFVLASCCANIPV